MHVSHHPCLYGRYSSWLQTLHQHTLACLPTPLVAVWCNVVQCVAVRGSTWQCVAVCGSVWQCEAVCCNVLQCVAVCCSVLQCVAVCCSAWQCVAVCCRVYGSSSLLLVSLTVCFLTECFCALMHMIFECYVDTCVHMHMGAGT